MKDCSALEAKRKWRMNYLNYRGMFFILSLNLLNKYGRGRGKLLLQEILRFGNPGLLSVDFQRSRHLCRSITRFSWLFANRNLSHSSDNLCVVGPLT